MKLLNRSEADTLFSGYSKLSLRERHQRLIDAGLLTQSQATFLVNAVDTSLLQLSDNCIENVIGCTTLPLGVAMNFCIDGVDRVIPMAVEETSILAAASRTARFIRNSGSIKTDVHGNNIIGQIQFAAIKDPKTFASQIESNASHLMAQANEHVVPNLVARGGGVNALETRFLTDKQGDTIAVIHVLLDPCDAMGANLVNQVCEFLKMPLEHITGERVAMCILSNRVDTKVTTATVRIPHLNKKECDAIIEASAFAELDPYRAATHNKGILNGIDAVLLATGNDWRAVEAGVHAYASKDGQYRPLATWHMENNDLVGRLEAPIIVGTVGGVTRLHPMAQLSLQILGVEHAEQLSRIAAAVGLVQNLGALRALTSEGITQGHMKLHINNLILGTNANDTEIPLLKLKLEEQLKTKNKVSQSDAVLTLKQLRQENDTTISAE